MRSSSKGKITVDVRALKALQVADVAYQIDNTKTGTVLNVPATGQPVVFTGTVGELQDFASGILGSVYSWMLANKHEDWFTEGDQRTQERM